MATAQEAVRRLTIVTSAPGADQAAASLQGVAKAMDGVTVASQKQEKATLSLDQKFASIERKYVEQVRAQQDYEKIQRQVNAAVAQNPQLQERANVVLARAAERFKAVGVANDNLTTSTGLARHEVINLSRQLQDVGVSLAGGQSPFTVLAQQGTQIADIFGSSKNGSIGGALKQFVGFVGPLRLVGLGVAGIAAAGALAINSVLGLGKQLDDVARSAGTTLGYVRDISSAASIKGIDRDSFLKAFQGFGDEVYQARNNMGQLGELLRANGQSVKSTQDGFEKVADLIKNASDDQQRLQLLQRAGLPATMEWVRFMSQGAAAVRQAAAEAEKLDPSLAMLVAKAREFEENWNRGWANFKRSAQNATIDIAGWLDSLSSKGTRFLMSLPGIGQNVPTNILRNAFQDRAAGLDVGSRMSGSTDVSSFYERLGTGAPGNSGKSTVDPAVLQRQISLQQQQLGIYGQTVTAVEAVRQVELQVQAARLQGVAVDQKRVEVLKQLAYEQSIGVTAIKAQADAARLDAETVGMSVEAATRFAAAQNAINEARRAGRELTPENIAQIQREAEALGQAAGRADMLRSNYEGLVRGPLQTFTSSLMQGASAWDAFGKAAQSALNSITSKLTDMIAQNLWQAAFGGSNSGGGGLGSIFGSMFGGPSAVNANGSIAGAIGPTSVGGLPLVAHTGGIIGSDSLSGRYVHPSYFDDAPRFHTGGIAGDEVPIIARRGEGVFTPGQMAAMGGGAAPQITVNLIEDSSRAGEVRQNRNSNGGFDIDVMVDSITAKNIGNPGSATRQTLGQAGRLASR